ncbi:hypothetical protein CI105_08105 [Candidatus Izimaplasma bacterium ZiA1]|uniref:hypothetical protein n=1 Tax=Candidatus Izimoplasma sp. ZiA1 TaxID=2024899 RepID=UPI000BAA6E30|nr:hypothetical protein CI105_08105 [Candidatus Izimaplasma bacterium ZiA1]
MKAIIKSFKVFVVELFKDGMIIMILIAPFLIGSIFKFAIPFLELKLTSFFDKDVILTEYFLLFDLLLLVLTPYFISFAASMSMLDEYDLNLINHLSVTPLGKKGYLISRIILPLIIAYFMSILILIIFSLTTWSLVMLLSVSLLTCLLSLTSTLIVFSYSKNKIEGLALAKLSGVVMIGIFIPFILEKDVQYYFSFLPSFWIGKFTIDMSYYYFILALLLVLVWLFILYKKFISKLSK